MQLSIFSLISQQDRCDGNPPKNALFTSFPGARGKTGCAGYWLDLALLFGQRWPSPILGMLGAAAEQPGAAVGIGAAARAHQLCTPLPGCGSGVKGMAGPSWPHHSLSPPRAVCGLGDPPLPPAFAPQIKENK